MKHKINNFIRNKTKTKLQDENKKILNHILKDIFKPKRNRCVKKVNV